jgi:hypothetical protein
MGNRSVTADDVVLFVVMTTIVGIMLTIEATDIVSNRVWVRDPVRNTSITISDSGENASID